MAELHKASFCHLSFGCLFFFRKVTSREAHGVAWEYAGFSLEREEYLDEMWEQYKKDGC